MLRVTSGDLSSHFTSGTHHVTRNNTIIKPMKNRWTPGNSVGSRVPLSTRVYSKLGAKYKRSIRPFCAVFLLLTRPMSGRVESSSRFLSFLRFSLSICPSPPTSAAIYLSALIALYFPPSSRSAIGCIFLRSGAKRIFHRHPLTYL